MQKLNLIIRFILVADYKKGKNIYMSFKRFQTFL